MIIGKRASQDIAIGNMPVAFSGVSKFPSFGTGGT